jgi:xanthine dehydrogenase accessory factor
LNNSDIEVLEHVANWLANDRRVQWVTLVRCWGSAPRPVGSMAAIRDDGAIIGSVSGGCIEKELTEMHQKECEVGVIQRHISSEEAMRFGLPCGGALELVFEKKIDKDQIDELISVLRNRKQVCRSLELSSGATFLTPVAKGQEFEFDGRIMRKVFGPAWRLLLIGAGELSRYVAEIGLALDYDVLVCEPREHFAKTWAVKGADIVTVFPDDAVKMLAGDSTSAVLALTHDPNLDDLALVEALNHDSFYVGALGSRQNHRRRCERLIGAFGLAPNQLTKLHGPVGLDIGSKTPAEIAVSIMAQITSIRRLSKSN